MASPISTSLTRLSGYVFCALSLCYIARHLYRVFTSPLRRIPGPSNPSLLFGNTKELAAAGSSAKLEQWVEEYGPVIKYKDFLGKSRLYTTDTKAINHILMHHYDYQKPPAGRFLLSQLLGNGVIITEEDPHKFQRRVMNPAFGPAQIRQLTSVFVEKSIELCDAWKAQIAKESEPGTNGAGRINVLSGLSKMTLDVIGLAGFNYQFNAINTPEGDENELNAAFQTLFSHSSGPSFWSILRMQIPPLRLLPTFRGKSITSARNTMDRIGKQLLEDSKRVSTETGEKSSGRDLLSLLVKSNMNEKDGERMEDEDVLAQVPTFLVAGHETTSTATTWALYALTEHPDVQCKLRDELMSLPTSEPSMEKLNSLPYLDAFVREVLRLHAPVPGTVRVAMRDGVIPLSEPVGGKDYVEVAKGQEIAINILALNRSKKLWGEDAREFKPERWLNGSLNTSLPGVWGNMMTFLGGARACIGFRFSLVEMKALLFVLVREFEYELGVPKEDLAATTSTVVQRPFVKSEKEKGIQLPLLVKPYNP
ncbi:hypothetical protein V5O48_004627 [Marasmius crinis-equi]|uniref:Cytochrome P450 n=1 Tax=Marasmius crinis-equi TaxID=585013 RepID=A0ABR3FPL7_9AGAR